MSHMDKVGVRELRRDASAILRRVAAGETVAVTDRGRPVAVITRLAPGGLAQLEREGLVRPASKDLLEIEPVAVPDGAIEPSVLVFRGREE
jgi:prevent-host-death family protein